MDALSADLRDAGGGAGGRGVARPDAAVSWAGNWAGNWSWRLSLPALLIMVAFFGATLVASHYKRTWTDELLEQYADVKPPAAIVQTLLHYPISLEPPAFHLIVHGFEAMLGRSLQVERLPSMLFFALALYILYCGVRWLVGEVPALVALLVPMMTYARHYPDEARSYALLMAMAVMSLACWFAAMRSGHNGARRGWALAGLVLSLGLANLSHFNAVLLLVPVSVGEAVRVVQRRRIDWPVALALGLAAATLLLDVPFAREAVSFKATSYRPDLSPGTIVVTYRWLLGIPPMNAYGALAILLVLGLAIGAGAWKTLRARVGDLAVPVWTALVTLLLLPVLALGLSIGVTKMFEPRYTLPALMALALMTGLAVAGLRRRGQYAVLAAAVLASGLLAVREIRRTHADSVAFQEELRLPAAAVARGAEGEAIYVRSLEGFLLAQYYLPPEVAERFVLVYSVPLEYGWLHHDVGARFAVNLGRIAPQYHRMPYEAFRELPGVHQLLVADKDPTDEWIRMQLARDGYGAAAEGRYLNGELFAVARGR